MKSTDNQIGQRVGALLCLHDTVAELFGYGVYEGEFVPPRDINEILHEAEIPNPRIKLDDGKTVWGCECWWGPEEQFKSNLAEYEIKIVDIDEARKNRG